MTKLNFQQVTFQVTFIIINVEMQLIYLFLHTFLGLFDE